MLMKNKTGFIFIETIIVICILTIALMSLYNNYSKIITNTRELNTFDTAEYNYKTFFLKEIYDQKRGIGYPYQLKVSIGDISNFSSAHGTYLEQKCLKLSVSLPTYTNSDTDGSSATKISDVSKVCLLKNVTTITDYSSIENIDAYIIDYLASQDLNSKNDSLFLVEYKKADKSNSGEYLTYISSLTF